MTDNKELEYTPDIVNLTDDEGNEYTFEVLDAIESDDGRYLAMLPIYDDPQKTLEDSGELVIVKVGEENGEEYLYPIEDDDEYDFVADAFIERLQDLYEIDEQQFRDKGLGPGAWGMSLRRIYFAFCILTAPKAEYKNNSLLPCSRTAAFITLQPFYWEL